MPRQITEHGSELSKLNKVSRPIRVLCVLDYYLPGFKGGGPIRTIANMRSVLGDRIELAIFTRDRDLGSNLRYDGVHADKWSETDAGPVYYASPKQFGTKGLRQAIARHKFDIVYINSFFGFRSSIQIHLWLRRTPEALPILIAPRGEFSPGALAIKKVKKLIYLTLARTLGLYRSIEWHASTAAEKEDILRQFPGAKAIHLAEDPVDPNFSPLETQTTLPSNVGKVRVAFISRISPMKNLDGLLRILGGVSCLTELDIYGPIEDSAYWKSCERLISGLPANVSALYKGSVNPEMVSHVFARYDLFALPTHGENFGHVIFEALRAGTPVLVSDRTPWQTDPLGAIKAVPLENVSAWQEHFEEIAVMSNRERDLLRRQTRKYAVNYARNSGTAEMNREMFTNVVGNFRRA